MDVFCEYMVKRRRTFKDSILVSGIIAVAVFLSMIVLPLRLLGLELLIVVGIIYGAINLIRRMDIEYEYILTNSILDIDKIMSKKTRKRVMSIDFEDIEDCGPANGIKVGTDSAVKILDFTGDIKAKNVYYVDFSKEMIKYRVFFQPNAKILSKIKLVSPRLVNVREEDLQ